MRYKNLCKFTIYLHIFFLYQCTALQLNRSFIAITHIIITTYRSFKSSTFLLKQGYAFISSDTLISIKIQVTKLYKYGYTHFNLHSNILSVYSNVRIPCYTSTTVDDKSSLVYKRYCLF